MDKTNTYNHSERPLRILLETGDGQSASALLENGFLKYCSDLNAEVHVISPGAHFAPFVDAYRSPGVAFSPLSAEEVLKKRHPRMVSLEARLGRRLNGGGLAHVRRKMWKLWGERLTAADGNCMRDVINTLKPDCFVSANLNLGFGRGIMAMCRRQGTPTVGNVSSWYDPYDSQPSRPDLLTCWSEVVRDRLVEREGFLSEQIEVIGAPAFDPYFDPDCICTREELCARMGLDPERPILLYATTGQARWSSWDETGPLRALLEALDQGKLDSQPQIVLRLHPLSIDHYFEEFRARHDIVFSRYTRYCPCLRWWPSRDEVVLAGNLLRHADVCISPGSTMTIEAAIFDTPTLVPAFNPIMAEEYDLFFKQHWLNRHFRLLVQENMIALSQSSDELIAAIRRALSDPSWLAEGRKKIRKQLLGPLDGQATKRLAQAAVKAAARKR